ncbi:MAG: peptidase M50 [Deltaproteobacteria bacterium]|nr:peptidase M50 [Deltaproteobacteria bacterium]MBW2421021.1 peptidase M50 [Deltaproteobacteria bacterium]
MSESLLSSSWYRVAQLKPRRSSQTRLHRHHYRGQRWYVLQNQSTGRCQLLTPSAQLLIGLMDGERTTQEIWDEAARQLGDDCPTQDETIRVLGTLYSADSLRCDISPDTAETFRRTQRRDASERRRRLLQPLSLRFPLFDPDVFLERWVGFVRPLFSVYGALAWCVVVGAALVLGASHWTELTQDAGSRLLSGQSLLVLWIAYPCVKALHEFGHGFAAKVWGAEVHEMGIMFLVLMPVPYVDASAANVFSDKRMRMVVSAAGIGVEVFLAALALLVWLAVEPGLVRSVAYSIIWISGASTLLFNANPLLRFDGYFILSDWIEIPNLSARSNQYLGYLVQRNVFGLNQVRCPVNAPGEARWFLVYGIAAFVYRVLIIFGIALFIAGKFFILGVLLALLSLGMQVIAPAVRQISSVLSSPRFGEKRLRIVATSAGVILGLSGALLLLPVPLYTTARGVVWLPERAQVRAGADAFVTRVLVDSNARVEAGDPVVVAHDPLLEARVAVLEAELRALRARHYDERITDLAKAQLTEEEILTVEASLARALEQAREVVIRSPEQGQLVLPHADDLLGRFVKQGEIVGYVIGAGEPTARVVLSEADVELVRERTKAVEVRLARRIADVQAARIERVVPAATRRLPSRALGTAGGGEWAVDSSDPEGLRTLVPVFELDLALPETSGPGAIGEAVYVRFDHGLEPLALRAYRGVRRLLLSRLSV